MFSNLLDFITLILSVLGVIAAVPSGQEWLVKKWKFFVSDCRRFVQYLHDELPVFWAKLINIIIQLASGLLSLAYLIFFVRTIWKLTANSGIASVEQLFSSIVNMDSITSLDTLVAISILFAISYTLLVSIDLANRIENLRSENKSLSERLKQLKN